MSVKQNLFVSVFVHECLMMLNDVEYTVQHSNCLSRKWAIISVISFQLMFYNTLGLFQSSSACAGLASIV